MPRLPLPEPRLGDPVLTFPQARLETGVPDICRLPVQPEAVLHKVPAEGGCGGRFQLEQNNRRQVGHNCE